MSVREGRVKVKIEHDWATLNVKVYLYEASEAGPTRQAILDRYGWNMVEVEPGRRPEPSLVIPEDWLRTLIAEGSGLLPIDRAGERHLDDAIKVRDRILDAFLPEADK